MLFSSQAVLPVVHLFYVLFLFFDVVLSEEDFDPTAAGEPASIVGTLLDTGDPRSDTVDAWGLSDASAFVGKIFHYMLGRDYQPRTCNGFQSSLVFQVSFEFLSYCTTVIVPVTVISKIRMND